MMRKWYLLVKTKKIKMISKIKNTIKEYNLDGYIVPKNDEFFTEYSRILDFSLRLCDGILV